MKYFLLLFLLPNIIFAQDYTVRWGIVMPLSGPVAESGIDIRRGFEMAFSKIDQSKVKHELIFEDSQYDMKNAVSAANKLVSSDKVDIIVALWDTADPIAPIAEKHGVIHASIRWNSNLASSFKNTFTFESTYEEYARKTISLIEKLGHKKIAILNQESAGWNLSKDKMEEFIREKGLDLVSSQSYLSSETDHRVLVLKALKNKPDIVIINDVGSNLDQIARQIRAINKDQHITGYLGYPVDLSQLEGTYYITQLLPENSFVEEYKKIYKQDIYSRASLAYDMANIISSVYFKYKSKPTTAIVVKDLKAFNQYKGASGNITTVNGGKTFSTECTEMKVQNSKRVKANL